MVWYIFLPFSHSTDHTPYDNRALQTPAFAGAARKATGRALAARLLYLTECEALIAPAPAARRVDLKGAFTTTDAELDSLRVATIDDMDQSKLAQEDEKLLEDET